MSEILWEPSTAQKSDALVTAFTQLVNEQHGVSLGGYADLHAWTTENAELFWRELIKFNNIEFSVPPGDRGLVNPSAMPGAVWFPDAKLNFAWNLMKYDRTPSSDAIVFRGEGGISSTRRITWAELRRNVLLLGNWLKDNGVVPGDRIAGFVPNTPEAIIAMLASTAIGATWSSCSPDFGLNGLLDRFGQIKPKIVFTADGYTYNGKQQPSLDIVNELLTECSGIERIVYFEFLSNEKTLKNVQSFGGEIVNLKNITNKTDKLDDAKNLKALKSLCVPLPFNHPLFIMFSSGTTGKPKCIVHSAGGTLLQQTKEHRLHVDLRAGENLFFFTTTGWMMWNWLVTGLASGATVMLYDGSPLYRDGQALFDFAEDEKIEHFGTSAKYIDACNKAGLSPRTTHDLSPLRTILSTGSPLVGEAFEYVYDHISSKVCLSSMSGGTDILSCFVLGSPVLPVVKGELQCIGLGMDVQVFNDQGKPCVTNEKGELVCVAPFPCMPIGFWNDENGQRYNSAYFDRFDNVWCHGDFVARTKSGGMIIYGRSDSVLNPGGVRIGTAEIYRQVEYFHEVLEALVIGQHWQGDVRIVLFVRMKSGHKLDNELRKKINQHIRKECTPRHVPAKIISIKDIPKTRSGKIVELAVKKVVHGEHVENRNVLKNPEALQLFENIAELQY